MDVPGGWCEVSWGTLVAKIAGMRTVSVDRSKLEEVCERAAKYHRSQMADRATPLELTYEITGVPTRSPVTIQPDGWARVGVVRDAVELWDLAVYWNPETDKVKLEAPRPREDSTPVPQLVGDPLYPTNPVSSKAMTRPFTALAGFIYSFNGMDYTAEETEFLTAELGSIGGWTWRPEE
jgi:hypothetical protein